MSPFRADRRVEVRPNGTFACTTRPNLDTGQLPIEAEHQGKKQATIRRFAVRR